jgi:hypothetical protein
MPDHETPTDASWFQRPRNINLMISVLAVVCAGTVLAQLVYHPHGHFPLEETFGFHAWFGFVTFVVIVYLGRGLRLIVGRKEDYYDNDR